VAVGTGVGVEVGGLGVAVGVGGISVAVSQLTLKTMNPKSAASNNFFISVPPLFETVEIILQNPLNRNHTSPHLPHLFIISSQVCGIMETNQNLRR